MTTPPEFTFSDLVAGYVEGFTDGRVRLRTIGGSPVTVHLTSSTSGQLMRNLGSPYHDVSGQLRELLRPGQLMFSHGPVYPSDPPHFQAAQIVFVGDGPGRYPFEAADWWLDQLAELAAFYRRAQFGDGQADFSNYRTELRIGGEKTDRQIGRASCRERVY